MNKQLRGLKKYRAQQQLGLTLVELLIALSVSTVVVMGAANLVIQTMQARSSAEELRRKRAEWNLARRFIEAEVSSATRVITDVAAIEIPKECGIESDEFTHAIVFPLERPMRVRNDASLRENFQVLPSAIYGVQTIDDGSMVSGKALVRCGPRINHDNSYGGFYEAELCADGRDSNCREVILDNLGSNDDCDDGFCVNATACESEDLTAKGCDFSCWPMALAPTPRVPMDNALAPSRAWHRCITSLIPEMCVQEKATSTSATCSMSQKILPWMTAAMDLKANELSSCLKVLSTVTSKW